MNDISAKDASHDIRDETANQKGLFTSFTFIGSMFEITLAH